MSLVRDVATVGSATLASRLLGFVRDIAIAAMLGAGVFADAFFAVLQIVNFFRRLLAEGALNAAFVPVWLRLKQAEGEAGAGRFFQGALGAMLLAAGILAVIGLLFAPTVVDVLAPGFAGERRALAADYLRIAAPYVALAGATAIIASLLNAEGRVLAAALGVVTFNTILLLALALIIAFDTVAPSTIGALLAYATVAAGLAQLLVTGSGLPGLPPPLPRFTFSPAVRRFFVLALPGLIAAGIPQLKLIAGAMIASASPAAVSWLYYANRLYELPLGVVSIAIAAVLGPAIAAAARAQGESEMAAAQARGLEFALGLVLPAAFAFASLADPIARALFERGAFTAFDSAAVAAALILICVGLPGHALEKLFGAISFAHEDTSTPMLAALTGLAAAIVGALALFPHYGHVGVAAAIGVSAWVGATLIGVTLWRRGWLLLAGAATPRLPGIVLAAIAMTAAILGIRSLLAWWPAIDNSQVGRIAALAVLVVVGLGVYLAGLELLGVARVRDLARALRHRP